MALVQTTNLMETFFATEKEFNVGKHLEIEMEFKSSELSGILLSIAESPVGSPSLSIEVFNGKVCVCVNFKFTQTLKKLSSR